LFGLSGISDFGARYLDKTIGGRFWSQDPLATAVPEMTTYHYAANNPLSFIDPTGMSNEKTTGGEENREKVEFEYTDGYGTYSSKGISSSISFNGFYNAVGGDEDKDKKKTLVNEEGQKVYADGKPVYDMNNIPTIFEMDTRADDDPTRFLDDFFAFFNPLKPLEGFLLLAKLNPLRKAQAASHIVKYAFGFGDEAVNLANKIKGKHLMKDPNWKSSFLKVINNPKSEIHFSLNGIDQTPMSMITSPMRSSTNWEMHQLYQSEAFERTIFHFGNKTYKGFEVFKIKP